MAQRTTLTILGSGSSTSAKGDRAEPSYLLRTGERGALLDCGDGAVVRLGQMGYNFSRDLDYVFITHRDHDHTNDLISLVMKIQANQRYFPSRCERSGPLVLCGFPGLADFYGLLRVAQPTLPPSGNDVEIRELADGQHDFGDLSVETKLIPHKPDTLSMAVRFETGAGSFVYSGDCVYSQDVVDIAAGADVALLDAGRAIDGSTPPIHPTPAEAGRIGREAHVERLILTHLLDIDPPEEVRRQAERAFGKPIELAQDLKTMEL